MAQSAKRLATGWTVGGSNAGEGEIIRTSRDLLTGPHVLQSNGYRAFPGGEAAEA